MAVPRELGIFRSDNGLASGCGRGSPIAALKENRPPPAPKSFEFLRQAFTRRWRERAPMGHEADRLCNDIVWMLFELANSRWDSPVTKRSLLEKVTQLEDLLKVTAP